MAGENPTLESIQNNGIPVIQFGITPSQMIAYPTDSTLSNVGQAADAAATGEAVGNIENSISDLNNELYSTEIVPRIGKKGLEPRVTDLENGTVKTSDIETTLETTGKVADSKAVGDRFVVTEGSITAAEQRIEAKIDTTLAVEGGIAEAKATGTAIATAKTEAKTEAVAEARTGVVLSIESITPDTTTHNVSLATLMATTAEVQTAIDQVLAGQ